jgi:hypothetical protein
MIVLSTALAGIIERIGELGQWLTTLDRPFAFLLALPFIVALAGLAGELKRHRWVRPANRPTDNGR